MKIRCFSCMHEFDSEFEICPECGYDINSEVDERALRPSTWLKNNRYYVGRVLGKGGFAISYIAWDTELNTKVAIKEYFPSDWVTRDPENQNVEHGSGREEKENFFGGKEAFINESKSLAAVGNLPGIVNVYDRFEENETAYIVMEFVPGGDLGSILRYNGTYTYSEAIKTLLPVMRSLAKVHGKGIVHKDIAPDNIMYSEGKVKLIDFGSSNKITDEAEGITLKPGYAPVEQYEEGRVPTPSMDVYALGAVLYHLITGVRPPDSITRQAALDAGEADPLVNPNDCELTKVQLPDELAGVINQAMAINEEDRINSVVVLADMLEPYVEKEEAKEIQTGESKRKLVKILVPVIVAVLAAIIGVVTVFGGAIKEKVMPEKMVTMPDVCGLTYSEAEDKIEELSLKLDVVENDKTVKTDDKSLNGLVASQNPEPDAEFDLNRTSEVEVALYEYDETYEKDSKNRKITVPDVVGKTKKRAKLLLINAGFINKKIKYKNEYSEEVAKGRIMRQSVKSGTVVKGTTSITLVISNGPEPTKNPSVLDLEGVVSCSNYTAYASGYTENQDYATLRYGPDQNKYNSIGKIDNGSEITVESESKNGYTLVYAPTISAEGWIRTDFIKSSYEKCFADGTLSDFVYPDYTFNDVTCHVTDTDGSGLFLRTGPGQVYSVIDTLSDGSEVTVKGYSASNTNWAYVYSAESGGTGWVWIQYLSYEEETTEEITEETDEFEEEDEDEDYTYDEEEYGYYDEIEDDDDYYYTTTTTSYYDYDDDNDYDYDDDDDYDYDDDDDYDYDDDDDYDYDDDDDYDYDDDDDYDYDDDDDYDEDDYDYDDYEEDEYGW